MKIRKRSSVLAPLIILSLLPAAAAQADTSGGDIVGYLNAQRAANGLPAAITEDAGASAACAAWSADGQNTLPAGAETWEDHAGAYAQGPWTATDNPFERHPQLFPVLLAPRLASFGAADVNGRGCATLAAPGTRSAPAQDVTYTYPGDGVRDVRTSQLIDTAAQPANRFAETGSVLYALFDGPDLDPAQPSATHVTAASLTGPDGTPVAIDTRDVATPILPTEVQLTPRSPLAPFTTYHASVTADVTPPGGGAARSFSHAWSFTTGGLENQLALRSYTDLDADVHPTGTWQLAVASRAPQVTLTATGPDGATITQTATSADYWTSPARFTVPLGRGFWRLCFTSGGEGTDHRAASVCDTVNSFGPPAPQPSPVPVVVPRPAPPVVTLKVSVAKGARARWRGRVLTVSGVRCSAGCSLRVAGTLRAGSRSYRLGTARARRVSAGTVTIKYTISKSLARKLKHARTRRLALALAIATTSRTKPIHAALAVTAGK